MAQHTNEVKELFQAIAHGERKAFDTLFFEYYEKLKMFALQFLKQEGQAEDVVSELFIKLWLRRYELLEIAAPRMYLYTAIKNACLNQLRKDGKQALVSLEEPTTDIRYLSDLGNPENILETKELKAYLDHIVDTLPEQRRLVFKMIKEDGLKGKEVAELLGLSVRTIEHQVYKAVKKLTEQLDTYFNDPKHSRHATASKKRFFLLLLSGIIMGILYTP